MKGLKRELLGVHKHGRRDTIKHYACVLEFYTSNNISLHYTPELWIISSVLVASDCIKYVYCCLHILSSLCLRTCLAPLLFHFIAKVIFNNTHWDLSALSFIRKKNGVTFCYSAFFSFFFFGGGGPSRRRKQISWPCCCLRTHDAAWPTLSDCSKDKPWEPQAMTAC